MIGATAWVKVRRVVKGYSHDFERVSSNRSLSNFAKLVIKASLDRMRNRKP